MGYTRHHAIVVTGLLRDNCGVSFPRIEDAHAEARALFPRVTEIIESDLNGYGSFLIPPDGSKEGWSESDEGDAKRARFTGWLRSKQYEDGSSPFRWVEVQYGDDERETIVTAHSDDEREWKA